MSKDYRQSSMYDDYLDSPSTYYPPSGAGYSRSGSSYKPNNYYSGYYGGWDYSSRYTYAKKKDLIKPELYYLDESRISTVISAGFENAELLNICYAHYTSNPDIKGTVQSQDISKFTRRLKEIYNNIPKHLIYDTFKLYYNNLDQLKFEDRTTKEELKYKFLEKVNNPVSKIMTEKSNLKSAIFARNAVFQFLTEALEVTDEQVEKQSCSSTQMTKLISNLFDEKESSDKGYPSKEVIDEINQKLFDKSSSQSFENELLNNAMEICVELNKIVDEEGQEKIFNQSSGGSDKSVINKNTLETKVFDKIKQKIKEINLNTSALKEKLKYLVSKTENHFASKRKVEYEELLESDDISSLDEFEYLHPKLKKVFVADIMLRKVTKNGHLNVYLDTSGSMSDFIRMNTSKGTKKATGESTRKITFAKNLVLKFAEMKLLNNFYTFDTSVEDSKKDIITISMIGTSGGTSLNTCVNHINNQKDDAVIITDAEDTCSVYSDKVYFIGLPGCNFSYFDKTVLEQYVEKDQILIFDGTRTFKVDKSGKPI